MGLSGKIWAGLEALGDTGFQETNMMALARSLRLGYSYLWLNAGTTGARHLTETEKMECGVNAVLGYP